MVTVLTPVYNRVGGVKKLYNSLENQTVKGFEWLVVDDGSTDGLENLIEELQKKSSFVIHYLKKENGGKHTALNIGIQNITSALTFIVDSDDRITNDAIEIIERYDRRYSGQNINLCGYTFLRSFPDGSINGKKFYPSEEIASYVDVRILRDDLNADKAEVFYTDCLKEFPFPEFKGEKFLGEDIVWIRMAKKYNMVHVNKAIYIGQYQEDGLTKNRRRNNIKSPKGCMLRANEFLSLEIPVKLRLKCVVQHCVYGMFAGMHMPLIIKDSNCKVWSILLYLPSRIIYRNWKQRYT